MKLKKLLSMVVTASLTMTLFAGCGDTGSTSTSSSTSGTTQSQSGESEATPTVVNKSDLVVCMAEDLETFDPIGTSAVNSLLMLNTLNLRLYSEDVNAQPEAWLANEFNVISDNEIQISIHDGVQFSDGSDLTIEDVVFCLSRALESPIFSTLLATVESFEVVDELTFKINTTGPSPSIKQALMHGGSAILPQAYIEEAIASNDWTNPVSAGAYVFSSRSVGESVTFVKNENFFDSATSAQNDSITFKYIPEASNRTIMVETGEADVNYSFSTADYNRATENVDLTVHETPGTTVQYIGVDTTIEPFNDPLVRQAINYAINRDDVITVIVEGLGIPAYSVLPPATNGYVENPSDYSYDPDKARDLLAQAGYTDGFETKLMSFNDSGKRVSEIAQMFLADVGIVAELETYDSSVRMSMIANHQVPMFAGSWGAMSDADLVLPRLFTEGGIGAMNFTHYTHPELETILESARSTYDEAERETLYQQAVEIITDDAPWCPLYVSNAFVLTHSSLDGVVLTGSGLINLQYLHY